MSPLSRRDLIRLGALGAVALPAAGLVASTTSPATAAQVARRSDIRSLRALRGSVRGRVLLPRNPQFGATIVPFDQYVDFGPPVAVLNAANAKDVARGISYCRATDTPVAIRSGGHNYAGYSTTDGLLISVAGMNRIVVDAARQRVTVGAGTRLVDLYNALAAQGQMVPAGTCPTVGVAGHVLGGGFGLHARKYGLLADNLISARVVLADGRIVTASARRNADLFWAIRGAGGGNLCFATSFTFRTHPIGPLSVFKFEYPWAQGRQAFDAWQRMIPTMTSDLTMGSALLNNGRGTSDPAAMGVQLFGVLHGTATELSALLQPVIAQAGQPANVTLKDMTFMEQVLYFGNCGSVEECETVTPLDFYAKSSYAQVAYSAEAIETLFTAVEEWPGTQRNCMVESFAYGGFVNGVAAGATAFPHRDQLFCSQSVAYFGSTEPPASRQAAVDWLDGLFADMAPQTSGGAFINYIDGQQPDWARAYYGDNLPRLRRVKRKYDPDGFFAFPQAIP